MFWLTNRVVNPLLARLLVIAPIGRRVGRRLVVVRYVGRRTGRPRRLVAQAHREGEVVIVDVAFARRKQWWRNFSSAHPAELWLAGEHRNVTGQLFVDPRSGVVSVRFV